MGASRLSIVFLNHFQFNGISTSSKYGARGLESVYDHSYFDSALREAKNLPGIFELVKLAVSRYTGRERSGLMLGLADLGGGPQGLVGAFYPLATNIIVMNTLPLKRIRETEPEFYNPYVFYILLHEYLHTLGVVDESETRKKVLEISSATFGDEHVVTQLAKDFSRFMPKLVYPDVGWHPLEGYTLELVSGFDRSSYDHYIT